jgi:hypothetical protein
LPTDPIKLQPQALQRYRILLGDFMLEDMKDQIWDPSFRQRDDEIPAAVELAQGLGQTFSSVVRQSKTDIGGDRRSDVSSSRPVARLGRTRIGLAAAPGYSRLPPLGLRLAPAPAPITTGFETAPAHIPTATTRGNSDFGRFFEPDGLPRSRLRAWPLPSAASA